MLNIERVNDLGEAERLWRALSPNKFIFDDWDYRLAFYKYQTCPLDFYAAYEVLGQTKILVGLMPLQVSPKLGREFFSESSCEENRPFIKISHENILPLLYEAIELPAQCCDVAGTDDFTSKLPLEDYIYFLPLNDLKDFDNFLINRLSPKRRKSIQKELAEIEKNNIEIIYDDFNDLELLFEFNSATFNSESYLLKDIEKQPWRDLIKNPTFNWHMITLKLNDFKCAVSLAVLYNNTWFYLLTGVNFKKFPGLGKYLVRANITAAIKAKADIFDAGLGDCGWKKLWHFDTEPQYDFIKK